MEVLYYLIAFVIALLNIILFFKIWGMTNDISVMNETLSRIEDIMQSKNENQMSAKIATISTESNNTDQEGTMKYAVGELVVIKANEKQTHVTGTTNDSKYECYSSGGTYYDGLFNEDELFSWNEYLLYLKKQK